MSGGTVTSLAPSDLAPAAAMAGITVPACTHCPDCPRPPAHVLPVTHPAIARAFCSPCLVALGDWLASEGIVTSNAAESPALLEHLERELTPLRKVTPREAELGDACTLEQLRAMHIYGWTSQFPEPGPATDPDEPLRFWPSRDAFYHERGGGWSSEAPFGVHHRMHNDGQECCRWQVSVVATTGDTYASTMCDCRKTQPIALLGAVRPDPLYLDADRRFAGWAARPGRPLRWFRQRLARAHPVQSPPVSYPPPPPSR